MRYIHNLSGEPIYDHGEEASDKTVVESAVKEGVYLDCANLKYSNLYGANLNRVDLDGADLFGASLERASLVGASLEDASLKGANLKGANLSWVNLKGANLKGANLKGANLKGASLKYSNLNGANLKGANLNYANLKGANLNYASLVGANLSNATICIDGKTVKLKHEDYNYNNLTIESAESLSIKHWEQIHSILDKGEDYQKPRVVVITKSGLVISTGGDGCAHCAYKRQESNATCELGSCGNCCNGLWCEFQMNPTAVKAMKIVNYIKSKQEGE